MKNLLNLKSRMLFVAFLLTLTAAALAEQIVIVDGGSSGTRPFLYDTDKIKNDKSYRGSPSDKSLAKLSDLANGGDIESFVDSVKSFCGGAKKDTKLYILATAGMRMVEIENKPVAEALYDELNKNKNYGNCTLDTAMTISGRYEGLYAWIATGVEKGQLGISKSVWTSAPFGIIEIGGASIQQTYKKECVPDKDSCIDHPKIGKIYSKSYLGWGVNKVEYDGKETFSNKDYPTRPALLKGLYKIGGGFYKNNKDGSKNEKNIKYVQWLGISGNWTNTPDIDVSWTKGAAIDIISGNPIEAFNYSAPN